MKLCLGADDETAEGCLVKIKGQANTGNVGRLSDQDIDETTQRSLVCRPWTSWVTLITLISAGRANMQSTSDP